MKIALIAPIYNNDYSEKLVAFVLYKKLEASGHSPVLLDDPNKNVFDDHIDRYMLSHCEIKRFEAFDYYDALIICTKNVWEAFNYFDVNCRLVDFLLSNSKKIAYAADFSPAYAPQLRLPYARESYLHSFSSLSAIAKDEVESTMQRYAVRVDKILDPLFMLNKEILKYIADSSNYPLTDIYIAIFAHTSFNSEVIPKRDFTVVNIDDKAFSLNDYVRCVLNCECIISDAYRTIALAIALNKPFFAVLSKNKYDNERITALLESVHLSNRLISLDDIKLDNPLVRDIDFTQANNLFANSKELRWIDEALKNPSRQLHESYLRNIGFTVKRQTLKKEVIDYKIQNLLFPDCDWKEANWWMFYRGERLQYSDDSNKDAQVWVLNKGLIECCTYFNSLSVRKWDRYTSAIGYKLHLTIKGKFRFRFFGYRLETRANTEKLTLDEQIEQICALEIDEVQKRGFIHKLIYEAHIKKEEYPELYFDTEELADDGIANIILPVEYSKASIVGFTIDAKEPCEIYSGYWSAVCDKEFLNKVDISLCTTTFKKEDFILPNLRLLKDEIFNGESKDGMDELSKHLFVNVVDNGRTLKNGDVNSSYMRLYKNPNTGGAGGFSRGMLETIMLREREEFDATHIIFMDDDIKILPEAIKRTYALLRLVKDEYKDRFISGAMMDIDQMHEQYEDIGFCSDQNGANMPVKPRFQMHLHEEILRNEESYTLRNSYASWWYCCVPAHFADKNHLSYPIFYRGDDINFSLRNKASFITLNGICVWHLAFNAKVTPSLEYYLVNRNSLITQAMDGVAANISYLERIDFLYKEEIRKFNYVACEHLLDALEDFLKGPGYLIDCDKEAVIKIQAKKNEKLEPIETFGNIDLSLAYKYEHLSTAQMALFINTDNGHTLPDYCLRISNELPVIAYLFFESPGKQYLQRRLLAVDVNNKTGIIHEMDKARYMKLRERYDVLKERCNTEFGAIVADYREWAPRMRTVDFWREYLG